MGQNKPNIKLPEGSYALVPIKDLKPHPKNRNSHSPEQIERLAKLIDSQGSRHPIIVSNLSGCIAAGHGRLMSYDLLGWKEVPVQYQDFIDAEQEYQFLINDNSIALWAELDKKMIGIDLTEMGPFDIDLLGFPEFHMDALPTDGDGEKNEKRLMTEMFLVPPFSVLDTRQGYWQDRRDLWLSMGIESEIGRGGQNQPMTPKTNSTTLGAIPPNQTDLYGKYK